MTINWQDFHFLRPAFLWLLIPALAVLILGLYGIREQVKWQKIISPELRPFMIQAGSEKTIKWMQVLLFLFISLAVIGAAGPTWKLVELPEQTLETPLVIALDLSQSMMATDIQPNRLERAKFKIKDFLDANPGARTALIGFAGTAHVIVPLTRDYKIISSHLSGLSPKTMPFPGSDLESALMLADTVTNVTTAPGTLLLFSDDFTEKTFIYLQQYVTQGKNSVVIVPINTPAGADIPAAGKKDPMRDKSGKTIHSALNNDILSRLNSIDGIDISALTLDNSDMALLARNISSNLEFKEKEEAKDDDWQDEGLWFGMPLALFILLWFRKGWVIYSLFFIVTLSSCSDTRSFIDLWYTKDYQAQRLYDSGDFKAAAELFSDPLHKGVAYYKSGDYEEAILAFEQDTSAAGAYNLGLAYFQNGDYAAAEIAFGKAVEKDPDIADAQQKQAKMQEMAAGRDEADPAQAEEAGAEQTAENIENKDMEDLGGGGQEATEEDMQQERKEETVATDVRMGKELDEVPEDFESGEQDDSQKVLMRKVDDDPALFLQRKFAHQVRTKGMKPKNKDQTW